MCADRSINTTRTVKFTVGDFSGDLLIEWLSHAVQALELILTRIVVLTRQLINRRERVGVVRRKLWVD